MPLYKTEALVLRTYKLAEADRIVVFLTRDRGKKRGVANGARRARSRFAAALEPLTRVGIGYYEREQRELVRIGYAETQASPLAAALPDALAHVEYFAELLDEWAQEGDPNERLYRLGTSTLDALLAGVPTGALARYFEYWLLRLQGVYPPHLACRRCGAALGGGSAAWLQPGAEAFLCAACAGAPPAGEAAGVRVSPRALDVLASWGRLGPQGLVPLAPQLERELEAAHRALLARHLEKDLRSTRVLRDLRR
ncbi:MAG TPA: DNA repair protein RecO [Vicinamibacterales bacterium]|nr:DNA repair protein RecO [Vicinamibacterales bacterium]